MHVRHCLKWQILHDRIIVCSHFERIIIALHVHSVAIVHVVASILVCAAAPFHRNGQLDEIALFTDGIKLPFVAVSKKRPTHQRKNGFWSIYACQNANLAICGISSSLRTHIDWYGSNCRTANVHAAVITQRWHVWV